MSKSDLEKLKFSAAYLEQLIKGMHPNTGDVIFDPRDRDNFGLVNCLSFVHQYITKEIASYEAPLRDFELTEQALRSIPITSEGISITKFTEIINKNAREPGMNRLRGRQITGWLARNGYLENKMMGGKNFRCPTPMGNEIGISSYQYVSDGAQFIMNLYDSGAQKFILDNIDEIVRDDKLED